MMSAGLFILMDSEESVMESINKGVYGFLMPPIFEDEVPSRSRHYAVLSDYGCCYEGTEIFFFAKRNPVRIYAYAEKTVLAGFRAQGFKILRAGLRF